VVVEDIEIPPEIPLKEPTLKATFHQPDFRDFSIDDLVKDCSVVLYSKSKSTRPWIGFFVERCEDQSCIKVQWLKKHKFYSLDNLMDGSPYISVVEVETVKFSHVMLNVSHSNDRLGPYFFDRESKKLIADAYIERDRSLKWDVIFQILIPRCILNKFLNYLLIMAFDDSIEFGVQVWWLNMHLYFMITFRGETIAVNSAVCD